MSTNWNCVHIVMTFILEIELTNVSGQLKNQINQKIIFHPLTKQKSVIKMGGITKVG